MLANYTLDGTVVEPKLKTLVPGVDYMTAFQPWLDVQVMYQDILVCTLFGAFDKGTCSWGYRLMPCMHIDWGQRVSSSFFVIEFCPLKLGGIFEAALP